MPFAPYKDASLTSPQTGNLIFDEPVDHSEEPSDIRLFIGSLDAGKKINAASNPGVDQIVVYIVDADPGNGHEAAEIKLATSEAGLDVAVGGAALNLGVEVLSGVGNAAEIWIRSRDATGVEGNSTELSIETNSVSEYDQ